jgi:transporter family protein
MSAVTCALLSAFFAALTALLAKAGLHGIDSTLATAVRTVVVLFLAWGIVAWQGTAPLLAKVPVRTLCFLVASGLATGLSWLFYFRALQLGKVSLVAALDKTSLAMTVLLAALVLGEALTWKVAAGVALILGGTLLMVL